MGLLPFDRNNRTIGLPPLFFLRAYNETWCEQALNFTRIYNTTLNSDGRPKLGSRRTTMQLVFTVVLMALMGCTLCVDGFLRLFAPRFTHNLRLFLGRFNLQPIARILLHFAFFQFLPLLSSVFSRAEGQDQTEVLLMLLWMLLVELIRKKVQGMLLPTDGSSFSRRIDRFTLMDYSAEASHLVWVGFLIYTTLGRINYHSLDAVFVILWSLGLLKLVQRVVNNRLASGSWHTARNPLLIAAYMQQVMEDHQGQQEMVGCSSSSSSSSSAGPCDILSKCKFAVMGEETLVSRDTSNCKERRQKKGWVVTTPGYGYGVGRRIVPAPHQNEEHHGPSYCDQNEQKHVHLHLLIDDRNELPEPDKAKKEEKGLVTVGKIWKMHKIHKRLFCDKRRRHLEDLCLSFSLFKMLRRRFEHYPMVEVGSAWTRNLMLQGLLKLGGANKDDHERPFHVLQLELDILINYYQQAAAPVVMSQPILFFCNFVSSIIFLAIFIASVFYILLQSMNAAVLYCAAIDLVGGPDIIYLYIYLTITILLLVTVISIETYEFWTLYVFSNWNIVRLLCSYNSTAGLRKKFYSIIIAVRFCAHSIFCRWLTKTRIEVQQVSIVDACSALDRYSARTTAKRLPAEATPSIIHSLKDLDPRTGIVRLPQLEDLHLHSGGETTSTEIILACHLATELLEMTEHRPMTKVESQHKEIASVLSKYCMYLVAHVPQLLPDDETWVANRHEDVRSFLEEHASTCNCGCFIFCALTHDCRKENAMRILELREEDLHEPTTLRGVKLFRELQKRTAAAACNGRDDIVWKELATFWVKLLIYLAPSNDVQGHAKVLATWGSDLMTCLWAFCTHAGITRQPLDHNVDHNTGAMCV